MKIKTIKIKVTQDNQDFDLSEFFTGSNTIYTTNAQLIQEEDGLYWHAFFTYQQQGGSYLFSKKHSISNEKKAPDGFEEALLEFVKTNKILQVTPRQFGLLLKKQCFGHKQQSTVEYYSIFF